MAGKSRITETELRQMVDSGLSPQAIADRLGTHRTTVEARMRVLGITWTPGRIGLPAALTPAQEQEVIRKYRDEGVGATTLGREYGCDKGTIYNVLNRHGVGTRSVASRRTEAPQRKARVSNRDLEIAAMWLETPNAEQIAAKVGVTAVAVRYSLKKQGLWAIDTEGAKVRQQPTHERVEVKASANRDAGLRHDAFDVLTPEACYWAGMLCGDGCVSVVETKTPRVFLRLQRSDEAHLHKFLHWLGSGNELVYGEHDTNGTRCFSATAAVTSRRIADRLEELGVCAGKPNRFVPPTLAQSRDFWRGLVDADGSLKSDGVGVYLCGYPPVIREWVTWCDGVIGVQDTVRLEEKPPIQVAPVRYEWAAAIVLKELYRGAAVALDRKAALASRVL